MPQTENDRYESGVSIEDDSTYSLRHTMCSSRCCIKNHSCDGDPPSKKWESLNSCNVAMETMEDIKSNE